MAILNNDIIFLFKNQVKIKNTVLLYEYTDSFSLYHNKKKKATRHDVNELTKRLNFLLANKNKNTR